MVARMRDCLAACFISCALAILVFISLVVRFLAKIDQEKRNVQGSVMLQNVKARRLAFYRSAFVTGTFVIQKKIIEVHLYLLLLR